MRIVDAHHHIWRRADLPWLTGPMQPRIFGPYEPIRRDYPIEEYLSDCQPAGVTEAVYVQANWSPKQFIDEVEFVSEAADRAEFPIAIVAYADMLAEDVRPQLDLLARHTGVRGVRMQLHWHENPLYRFASGPDLARDERLKANVARLAPYGWAFDLQVFASQMAGAAELAAASRIVSDWDGGTRIGDALQAFLAVPRFAGYARGAVTLILSDGLERGDPAAMTDAVTKLARRSWRLDWLTPLASDPAFAPRTQALKSILPVIDQLADGGSTPALCAHVLALTDRRAA